MLGPDLWQPDGATAVVLAQGCRFSPVALHLAVADRDSGFLPIFLARGSGEMERIACRVARERLEGLGWVLGRVLPESLVCEQIRSAYAARYYAAWDQADEPGALPKWVRKDLVVGVGISRPVLERANVSGRARPVFYMH